MHKLRWQKELSDYWPGLAMQSKMKIIMMLIIL